MNAARSHFCRDVRMCVRVRACVRVCRLSCDTVPMEPVHHEIREPLQSVAGLEDGAIYFSTLTVRNNAGDWQTASSDGFRIDVSPPECGQIYDGPSFDRRFIGPTVAKATTAVSGAA